MAIDLTLDELIEAGEVLEEDTRTALENASVADLLELIRVQHAMHSDLKTALAVWKAANVRRLH